MSLSGAETAGIVRFLMRQPSTPDDRARGGRRSGVAARGPATPTAGGRASTRSAPTGRSSPAATASIRYQLEEIEKERQDGYAWYGTWPRKLVEKEYDRWKSAR